RLSCSFPTPMCTYIATVSLHDALPIYPRLLKRGATNKKYVCTYVGGTQAHLMYIQGDVAAVRVECPTGGLNENGAEDVVFVRARSEEHTSELQSRENLVCRLLLETKN